MNNIKSILSCLFIFVLLIPIFISQQAIAGGESKKADIAPNKYTNEYEVTFNVHAQKATSGTTFKTVGWQIEVEFSDGSSYSGDYYDRQLEGKYGDMPVVLSLLEIFNEIGAPEEKFNLGGTIYLDAIQKVCVNGSELLSEYRSYAEISSAASWDGQTLEDLNSYYDISGQFDARKVTSDFELLNSEFANLPLGFNDTSTATGTKIQRYNLKIYNDGNLIKDFNDPVMAHNDLENGLGPGIYTFIQTVDNLDGINVKDEEDLTFVTDTKEKTFTFEEKLELTAIESLPEVAGIDEIYTVTGQYSIPDTGHEIVGYEHYRSIGNMDNFELVSTEESFTDSYNTEVFIYYKLKVIQDDDKTAWSDIEVIEITDNTPTNVTANLNIPYTVYEGVDVHIDTLGSKVKYGDETLLPIEACNRDIADYDFNFSCDYIGNLSASGGTVYFKGIGHNTAEYELWTSMNEDSDIEVFNVVATPYITNVVEGKKKVNRKLTCDFNKDIFHQNYPINLSTSYVKVENLAGTEAAVFSTSSNNSDNIKGYGFNNNKIEFIIKKNGLYNVTKHVEDTRGHVDEETVLIEIVEDLPPVAELNVLDEYYRDENGIANINIKKEGYSPDLDLIQVNCIEYKVDSNNDKNFDNEELIMLSDNLNEFNKILYREKVGRLQFIYTVKEDYDTLMEYVNDNEFLYDTYIKTVNINNHAPYTSLEFMEKYKAELMFTGDITDEVNNNIVNMKNNIVSQKPVNIDILDTNNIDFATDTTPQEIQYYLDETYPPVGKQSGYSLISETNTTYLYSRVNEDNGNYEYIARDIETGTVKYFIDNIALVRNIVSSDIKDVVFAVRNGGVYNSGNLIELSVNTGKIKEYSYNTSPYYSEILEANDQYIYIREMNGNKYSRINRLNHSVISFERNEKYLGFYNGDFFFTSPYHSSTSRRSKWQGNEPTDVGVSIYKKGMDSNFTLIKRYTTTEDRILVTYWNHEYYHPYTISDIYGGVLSNGKIVISYQCDVEYDERLYGEKRMFLGLDDDGTVIKDVVALHRINDGGWNTIESNPRYDVGYTYHENYFSIGIKAETDDYFYTIYSAPYQSPKIHQFNKNNFSSYFDSYICSNSYYTTYLTSKIALKAFEQTGKLYSISFYESNKYNNRSYFRIYQYTPSTGESVKLIDVRYYHEDPDILKSYVKGSDKYVCIAPCAWYFIGNQFDSYDIDDIYILNLYTGNLVKSNSPGNWAQAHTIRTTLVNNKIYVPRWLAQEFIVFNTETEQFEEETISSDRQLMGELNAINEDGNIYSCLGVWRDDGEEVQVIKFPQTTKKLIDYIDSYSDKQIKYMVVVENDEVEYIQEFVDKIVNAYNNAGIGIIWMGNSNNQSTGEALAIGTEGVYLNNEDLTTSFTTLKNIILSQIPVVEGTQVIRKIKGEHIEYNTYYTDFENDPIHEPSGERWRYTMDTSKDHPDGIPPWNGQWLTSRLDTINYTGEYDVEYQVKDNPTNDKNFDNYRKWSIAKPARLIIEDGEFLEVNLYLVPEYPEPVNCNDDIEVNAITFSSRIPDKVEVWLEDGEVIKLSKYKVCGNTTYWDGIYNIPEREDGEYIFYGKAYMDALDDTDTDIINIVSNRKPNIFIQNIRPQIIYEKDNIEAKIVANDPDYDDLTVNIKLFEDTEEIYNDSFIVSAQNEVYPVTDIDVINNANKGNYTIEAYVTDPYGETDEDNITFIVNELSINGYVNHTEKWNNNRIKYNISKGGDENSPRPYNYFFPGERFILKANSTQISNERFSEDGMTIQNVSVSLINTGYSTNLTYNGNIWEGYLWDKEMIKWHTQDLVFNFKAIYTNGAETTCEVPVKIVNEDYWRFHLIR